MDPHKLAMRHSSKDATWRTPPAMVEKLLAVFPIEVDLAASDAASMIWLPNHPVDAYLGPGHHDPASHDALQVDWNDRWSCGFLNPPYSISLIKALREELAVRMLQNVLPTEQGMIKAHYARLIAALRIDNWAQKAYEESLKGFTTIGVFPYAPQTKWFRRYVMGHIQGEIADGKYPITWAGHAALDYWRIPHRVAYLRADGSSAGGANVNTCVIHWGPNPGFVGPWVPSGRFWSYR